SHLQTFPLFPYTTLFRSEENDLTLVRLVRLQDLDTVLGGLVGLEVHAEDRFETNILLIATVVGECHDVRPHVGQVVDDAPPLGRSEEHTSELQSRENLVC